MCLAFVIPDGLFYTLVGAVVPLILLALAAAYKQIGDLRADMKLTKWRLNKLDGGVPDDE